MGGVREVLLGMSQIGRKKIKRGCFDGSQSYEAFKKGGYDYSGLCFWMEYFFLMSLGRN